MSIKKFNFIDEDTVAAYLDGQCYALAFELINCYSNSKIYAIHCSHRLNNDLINPEPVHFVVKTKTYNNPLLRRQML